MSTTRKLAIIGVGPRGGYALEKYVYALIGQECLSQIEILLFEETGNFGYGHVYDIHQSATNWININERILTLPARNSISYSNIEIPSFPSYHEWMSFDPKHKAQHEPDRYPPRAKIGYYLQERFKTLVDPLIKERIVVLHKKRIAKIKIDKNDIISLSGSGIIDEKVNEVLFTIGHQPTESSDQIISWKEYHDRSEKNQFFDSPYPVGNIIKHKLTNPGNTIAVMGFGLAAIDIIRALASNYGRFVTNDDFSKSCSFQSDFDMEDYLLPFSLDGLPPVPKPINATVDNWFAPDDEQLAQFEAKIGDPAIQADAEDIDFLLAAIVPIIANIYLGLEKTFLTDQLSSAKIEKIITAWLKDQSYEHSLILDHKQSVLKTMQDFVDMATGAERISLDFCIGQVWRHCQPSIYTQLSFNRCSNEVKADLIAIDESTKRYSYGPPVESIQQLIALIKAKVLNLQLLNNPDIKLSKQGWQLVGKEASITANVMINSVLESPKIKKVSSPLVQHLLSEENFKIVHDDLGFLTNKKSYMIADDDKELPLAWLGRLAKGTVIGVDAILECFGERPEQWAIAAAKKHLTKASG